LGINCHHYEGRQNFALLLKPPLSLGRPLVAAFYPAPGEKETTAPRKILSLYSFVAAASEKMT
jgi:hypothetical protein